MKAPASLRAVAAFEAAKGALVLLAGFGLLQYAHADAQHVAETLVRHFHLNPASAHPRIIERLLQHVSDTQLRLLALGALAYASVRFVEAWGLWRERRWAEWLALASGTAYLPIELYEFSHTHHWAAAVVLTVNFLIVAVLAPRMRSRFAGHRSCDIISTAKA